MSSHPYYGATAALATKHHKDQIVCGAFGKLGVTIVVPEIDTDQLGTFTGEVAREGTPKEVVLRKARLGLDISGLAFGIASEGSIGPDPVVPFINSDIECMAWVDRTRDLEIVEFHRSFDIVAARTVVSSRDSLDAFLKSADFPNHALIARAENGRGEIYKGINSDERLNTALSALFKEDKKLIIESDLRAHHSPSRRRNIAVVAEKLVARLSNLCVECQCPGFGAVENIYGLPCSECGTLNERAVRGEVHGCAKCENRIEVIGKRTSIEPAECLACNP